MIEWLTTLTGALTALAVALTGLVPVVIRLWQMVAGANRRLDRIWRGRLLRGTAEGLRERLLVEVVAPELPDEDTDADPDGLMAVAVTPEVATHYGPVVNQLASLWEKFRVKDTPIVEFAEAIETRFGPWLLRNVCVPLGVSEYACIVMAISLAKGIQPVPAPADSRTHKPLPPAK